MCGHSRPGGPGQGQGQGRHHIFFSLAELNQALTQTRDQLNHQRFQKLDGTRHSFFETLDRPALQPLPRARYEFARWKHARVNIDYHVEVEQHYYSVPHQLVKKQVDVRFTATTVEILYQGQRVASHQRSYQPGQHTTLSEHRPPAHRAYLEWTPERLINWAQSIGPQTAQVVKTLLERRPHPEQAYRSCLGVLRLSRRYTPARLEAACARAVALGAYSYRSVNTMLSKGLDQVPWEERPPQPPVAHDNLRGADYFAAAKGDS